MSERVQSSLLYPRKYSDAVARQVVNEVQLGNRALSLLAFRQEILTPYFLRLTQQYERDKRKLKPSFQLSI